MATSLASASHRRREIQITMLTTASPAKALQPMNKQLSFRQDDVALTGFKFGSFASLGNGSPGEGGMDLVTRAPVAQVHVCTSTRVAVMDQCMITT